MILAAVMAKLGTYGIIRFDLNLFPRAVVDLAPLLLTLGVIGILYGAIVACVTRDLKRLVAYSSLAHLGFIVLGTFALTTQGVTGGVLQMVNHGLIIAVLFIVIGWIYERRQTWQTSRAAGPAARRRPSWRPCSCVAMLAAIGLPGLNGFVGEFLVLVGHLPHPPVVGGGGHRRRGAGRHLPAVGLPAGLPPRARRGQRRHVRDLSWREGAVVAPLVALIVFLGVYPKPVLDRITPSVDPLVHHVDRGHRHPPAGGRRGGAPAGAAVGRPPAPVGASARHVVATLPRRAVGEPAP